MRPRWLTEHQPQRQKMKRKRKQQKPVSQFIPSVLEALQISTADYVEDLRVIAGQINHLADRVEKVVDTGYSYKETV